MKRLHYSGDLAYGGFAIEQRKAILAQVVAVNPNVMHGTPCFAGTRVPVQALVDHLETGPTIDDFLTGFPTVTHRQAIAFIDLAAERLLECVSS